MKRFVIFSTPKSHFNPFAEQNLFDPWHMQHAKMKTASQTVDGRQYSHLFGESELNLGFQRAVEIEDAVILDGENVSWWTRLKGKVSEFLRKIW